MNNNILRYTLLERVMHWIAAVTYCYVLLTGLAFYSPHLYWIATILGGAPTSRYWHPWIAVIFVAVLVWMLRQWLADMHVTAEDRAWSKAMRHYVENDDQHLPPIDRFNVGQKYFFWAMVFGGAVLLLSGIVLWIPEKLPWSLRDVRYAAVLLHVSSALITVGAFIIHVYMGTAVVRGGFTSIIRGEVSPAWAKTHHRLWYQRVTGK
ncbi:formate dehydrogenase O, cytochrome b556 subunit [Candidatus Sulfopaludibacter sp. SbA3]|nr:formate dehydrogenase O, cytochrome b556 subunit [Candidatus Sulfopaludibacter sp. SbA3]